MLNKLKKNKKIKVSPGAFLHTQGTKEWVERTDNWGFKNKVLEILASKVVFFQVTDGLSLH